MLVERARRLLADPEQTLDDIQRQVLGLEGRVRVGASTGVIAYLLPQALGALRQRNPAIDVQFAVLTLHEALSDWRTGRWMSDWSRCHSPPWPDW